MSVAAHICSNRQIASHGHSEESKCSIQEGLCHLSRKLTAIAGIGFLIPASFETRLLLQRSCLTLTGHLQLHTRPHHQHHTHCHWHHRSWLPSSSVEAPRNRHFISLQAHQNKETLILQVTRIHDAVLVLCTERKQQQSILLTARQQDVTGFPAPRGTPRCRTASGDGAWVSRWRFMAVISTDHSLSQLNAEYTRFYQVSLRSALPFHFPPPQLSSRKFPFPLIPGKTVP